MSDERNDMDKELAELLDKQAIIEVINRLFIATDRKDWPGVEACFLPEVDFDMTSLGGGEPKRLPVQEIVAGWETGLAHIQAIHHQAGNYLVEVTDREATAFCYGIASHYLPNPEGRNTRTFVGSYDFRLEKGPGGWRISAFRFNLKYVDGNPNLEAETKA
jgi:hypothetical protein